MKNISGKYAGRLSYEDACSADAALDSTDVVLSLDDAIDYSADELDVSNGFLGFRVRGGARLNVETLAVSDCKNDLIQCWNGGVSIEHFEARHTLPCTYSDENHADVFQAFAKKSYGDFGPLPSFTDLYIGSADVVVECHDERDKKNGFIFSEVCEYRNISLFPNGLTFKSNSSAPYVIDMTSGQNVVIGSEHHPIDPELISGKAIRIGGQKSGAPKCEHITIHCYAGLRVVFGADAKENTKLIVHNREEVKKYFQGFAYEQPEEKEQSFRDWVDGLKNLNAPAMTENDIEAAANLLGISPAMVAAVFAVESRGKGFNRDGSVRMLLERHKVYKYAEQEGCLDEMLAKAGTDVCSKSLGGYVGGVAEYERFKRVGEVSKRVAALSASYGAPQIMGLNHKLIGYDTPEEMIEDFHAGEGLQLQGFVKFISANGLAQYLREAEALSNADKSPLGPLDSFAKAYNGKAHKGYHLKIAAAYKAEKAKREGYKVRPIAESTTVQGGVTATVGTIGAGVLTAKEILDSLNATKDTATEIITDTAGSVQELTGSNNNYILWAIIALLVLAQFGVFTSLWARIKDRLLGYNL